MRAAALALVAYLFLAHPAQSRVEVKCQPVTVPDVKCSLDEHFRAKGLSKECRNS